MIEFVEETLALLPYLFVTYLAIEWLEARAGGALGKILGRSRRIGPAAGAALGAVPQCGFSAAAASLYAGGVVSAGTLLAVFLSTSDEMLPVLLSSKLPAAAVAKIVAVKAAGAVAAGFAFDALARLFRKGERTATPHALCEHSRCGCSEHGGIFRAAAIHTLEIFVFIAAVAGAIELALHFAGDEALAKLWLDKPWAGELAAGALGLVPNCAVSAAAAKLYADGAIGFGPLMASSFTGCGVGLLVLFRTNRSLKENLAILAALYASGVLLGRLAAIAMQ